MPSWTLYAEGQDLTRPYLSPLHGDFAKGILTTILTTGTRDMLLSDTVRMHRALRGAGVAAELHVQEAAGHTGFFGMAPEDQEITSEIRCFLDAQWVPPAGSRNVARVGTPKNREMRWELVYVIGQVGEGLDLAQAERFVPKPGNY